MPRLLLIKTSSLGDVIHNLPVVSDIVRAVPDAQIDWVVEEGFADIPRLHPAISRIIPVALRRWRKSLLAANTQREIGTFRQALQQQTYDAIIDTQGLLKSALIGLQATGPRHGMNWESAREPLASLFYSTRHAIARDQHAVTRNRLLAAAALRYQLDGSPDYGLAKTDKTGAGPAHGSSLGSAELIFSNSRYVVLLTATSRDDKLWPEERWVTLGQSLHAQGYSCRLPAGNVRERQRATEIAARIDGAQVVPPASIAQLAEILRNSAAVVGVDTGLVHLAAALGKPTVAIYCTTEPGLTGAMADRHSHAGVVNLGSAGKAPVAATVINTLKTLIGQRP